MPAEGRSGGQSRRARSPGLLPVVMIALGSILVLRIAHIAVGETATPATIATAMAQESTAAGSPAGTGAGSEVAGTSAEEAGDGGVGAAGSEPGSGETPTAATGPATPDGAGLADRFAVETADPASGEAPRFVTRSEIDLLQRLADRRTELEQRARDLEMREALIMAAERRVDEKLDELKQIAARVEATFDRKENEKNEQFQGLVGMYENMKPKEAARIFDTLDMDILLSVVEQMPPRKMAPILADMSPEAAQRLTIELAARASGEITAKAQSLPVIADRDPG